MNLNQQINETPLESYGRRSSKKSEPAENGFYDLGIVPKLMNGVDRLNFTDPTPVQKEAIPIGISGKDIIAIAQTGSGKTLAFGIPMLQRLSRMKRGIGLVLVPTRELAIQVDESIRTISRSVNIRSTVLIGGASMSLQRNALKKNPRIIIATPGRLMDHLERRTLNLDNVEVFILDEADRMLDMGFVPDIKKIIKSMPDKYQTMLFSATMPGEIEAIAKKLMANPTRIETDRSGATPVEVTHEIFFIKHQAKSRLLAFHVKKCSGPVLVFTRTKRMAKQLAIKINDMGFACSEIHSNRTLGQRQKALDGFKKGRFQVLIATDIASRGIDVTGIELVVNYDMPANSEDYVHRIGRTGRAGKTGHAISFATATDLGAISALERFMKTKLTTSALPDLPSEKLLIKEAEESRMKNRTPHDKKPYRQQYSTKHSSRRNSFKKKGSNEFSRKRTDSRQTTSNQGDFNQNNSNSENAFWSRFKKKRPDKKKSVGQGSGRRKRFNRI